MVNKILPPSSLPVILDLLEVLSSSLHSATPLADNAIRTIFWISKALILRLASVSEILTYLLNLLSSLSHGLPSARGFSLLLAPDEILSKENGATIRLLAKQRVFTICIPRLAADFRSGDPAVKQNYLIALSGILKYVPTDILMPEISTLLPLLLQSLDLPETNVKAATIETLSIILVESPEAVEEHMASLVTRLLKAAAAAAAAIDDSKSSSSSSNNSTRVRQSALRCLRLAPGKVKESKLLPLKGKVTWELRGCLDDRKRGVRKEAIECRAQWLGLDEPDSE